mgnify:CR=1 FL=1
MLAAIALIKRFPYRRFVQTHRVMAAVYLALVVHGVVLLPFAYWTQPLGMVMGMLMAAGSWAALRSLAGRIGRGRRAHGHVERVVQHPANQVLEVGLRLDTPWPGHQAGQFAFVTFDEREGPHPFTISSAWGGDGRMDFMIKPLGDYTRSLPATLKEPLLALSRGEVDEERALLPLYLRPSEAERLWERRQAAAAGHDIGRAGNA